MGRIMGPSGWLVKLVKNAFGPGSGRRVRFCTARPFENAPPKNTACAAQFNCATLAGDFAGAGAFFARTFPKTRRWRPAPICNTITFMTTHDHAHDHGPSHSHGHSHAPALTETVFTPRRAMPAASVLRMSLAQRLAIALGAIAAIWLCVFWAMR